MEKIQGYNGSRFFLIGPAKYPGKCSRSGWRAGVDQLVLVKDNRTRQVVVLHREWVGDYCRERDPSPQLSLDLNNNREENLRQIAALKAMLDAKSGK